MYFDWTYILVIIGAVISALASLNVKSTFNKYGKVLNSRGLTGQQTAALILRGAGITDVAIGQIAGELTDHYAPNEKVLRLSEPVYDVSSVAAVGVAAHECGHAIQHQTGYAPLKLRSASVPVANIGSWVSWPLIVLGIMLGFRPLSMIGVVLFTFVVLFQLVTLPVELDASRRSLKILEEQGILTDEEMAGARKVLTAAALTYVAALFSAILQLLRLILITRRRR